MVRELLRALAARDDHRYLLYARARWEEPLDERFTLGAARRGPTRAGTLGAARAREPRLRRLPLDQQLPDGVVHDRPDRARVYDLVAVRRRAARRAARAARSSARRSRRRSAARRRCRLHLAGHRRRRRRALPVGRRQAHRRRRSARSPALRARAGRRPAASASCSRSARSSRARTCRGWSRPTRGLPEALRDAHPLLVGRPRRLGGGARRSPRSTALGALRLLGHVSDADLAALYAALHGVRLPVARRGLRPAGAGGDGRPAPPVLTSRPSRACPRSAATRSRTSTRPTSASIGRALEALLTDDDRRADLGERARERAAASAGRAARKTRRGGARARPLACSRCERQRPARDRRCADVRPRGRARSGRSSPCARRPIETSRSSSPTTRPATTHPTSAARWRPPTTACAGCASRTTSG